MNSVRKLLILLICVVLTACGGGGGGGKGGDASPGSEDTGETPGGGDGGDGGDGDGDTGSGPTLPLFSFGMGAAELTLTLARLSTDAFLVLEANSFATLDDDCADGGGRTIAFTDADTSGGLTVGDRIEMTFTDCAGSAIADVANGTIRLTLDSLTAPADPAVRSLVFSETLIDFVLGADAQQTTIEGGFQLQFDDSGTSGDTLIVMVNSGFLRYGFPSDHTVSLEAGSQLQKTLDLDSDTYSFGFEQTLDVTWDGETFTLYADTFGADVTEMGQFSGNLLILPAIGAPFVGAARFYVPGVGSQCLLTHGSDTSNQAEPAAPLLRSSGNGDDCMTAPDDDESVEPWQNFVAGALFSDVDNFGLRQ